MTGTAVGGRSVLTDKGSQFTDRFTAKGKTPSGAHAFDKRCAGLGIEHRLAPPRHPQTNGMVERFNGRITEVIAQTRFKSAAELQATLTQYVQTYNSRIPQRALDHRSPIQALQDWRKSSPELFTKRVHDQPGLDNAAVSQPASAGRIALTARSPSKCVRRSLTHYRNQVTHRVSLSPTKPEKPAKSPYKTL